MKQIKSKTFCCAKCQRKLFINALRWRAYLKTKMAVCPTCAKELPKIII